MGEAKRRKQLLGDEYGKKTHLIIKGTEDLQFHAEKLEDEWYEILEEYLGNQYEDQYLVLHCPTEEFQQNKSKSQQWLQDYMRQYRPKDQAMLSEYLLEPIYMDLIELLENIENISDQGTIEGLIDISVPLIFWYSCFKEYVSKNLKEFYLDPIQMLYETFWEKSLEDDEFVKLGEASEDQELAQNINRNLKYLFNQCLDLSSFDSSSETQKSIIINPYNSSTT